MLPNSNLENLVLASETTHNSLIGLGAVAAGLSILPFIERILKKLQLNSKIIKLKDKYPLEKYQIDFDFVNRKSDEGTIFLRDLKTNELRHIVNPQSVKDLDFWNLIFKTPHGTVSENVNTLSYEKFYKLHKFGSSISTT